MLVSWCATAGVSPTPKSVRALARGVGLDSKQVWRIVAGLSDPRGITVDGTGGKVYWTDLGADKIRRANLDGTEIEDLVSRTLD